MIFQRGRITQFMLARMMLKTDQERTEFVAKVKISLALPSFMCLLIKPLTTIIPSFF